MSLGRASRIGWTTIGLYFLTTIAAAIIGIVCIIIFRSKFVTETFEEDGPAVVTLGCGIPGTYIAEGEGGTLSCTADFASEEDILFEFDDVVRSLNLRRFVGLVLRKVVSMLTPTAACSPTDERFGQSLWWNPERSLHV